MKEQLIKLIIACDKESHGVATHKSMSPSSSVEEIAEYMSELYLEKHKEELFAAIEKIQDYGEKFTGRTNLYVRRIENKELVEQIINAI